MARRSTKGDAKAGASVGFPPGEAIRGPSRSSTALDPEPTAQTDPQETFMTAPPDESLYRKADDQMPSDRG